MRTFDILTISDFRLPGGTSHSTAQELAVHKRLGLTTGLVQAYSRLVSRPLPWSSIITRELAAGAVVPVLPGEPVRASLALLRHPVAAEAMPDLSGRVRVDRAIVIANQAAIRPDGTIEYDPAAVTGIVTARLGVEPWWGPIGPVVRRSIVGTQDVRVLPQDWTNIFSSPEDPTPRSGFDRERLRIGRHSRPQHLKWPDTATEILSAYPASPTYDVRVLGGAEPAREILGELPSNWTVHEFGSVEPSEFLEGIDFWVYFHHPDWSEAYGRAIMEALWSGAVVILPEYLCVTFGEAAVYCDPHAVTKIIDEFRTGRRDFLRQSALGQAFARAHAPSVHAERIRSLIGSVGVRHSPEGGAASSSRPVAALTPPPVHLSTRRVPAVERYQIDERPRALFVTSNGAGMGHLTRMLGLAREVSRDIDPVFFSMSQGVSVVAAAGLPYEYVPISSALQTKSDLWHAYLQDRMLSAIDAYGARIVVFDGTWPYKGLLAALDQRDVLRVWVRRAMWKDSISPEQLLRGPRFDLVIEPGEHAEQYDKGATTTVRDATRVPPMTVLAPDELLPREAARAELGLSSAPDRHYVLVTLGAGNINDLESTQTDVLAAIAGQAGWEAILTKAPIAGATTPVPVQTLTTFPLARYTRAFDFAVSAAGYNSFSEWISGCLPTVWIPNLSTMTDDQDARARWAADHGFGLRALDGNSAAIRAAVEQMTNEDSRRVMTIRLKELAQENGAIGAAQLVTKSWRRFRQGRGSTW